MSLDELGDRVSVHRPRWAYLALLVVVATFSMAFAVTVARFAPAAGLVGCVLFAILSVLLVINVWRDARTEVELHERGIRHRVGAVTTTVPFARVTGIELRERAGQVHTVRLLVGDEPPITMTRSLSDFGALVSAFHRAGLGAKARPF